MCILGRVGEIGTLALCFGYGYRSDDAVLVHRERLGIESASGAVIIIILACYTWTVSNTYQQSSLLSERTCPFVNDLKAASDVDFGSSHGFSSILAVARYHSPAIS